MLLAVSICHIVLAVVYHGQCPVSPYLSITLIITGVMGFILSIIALIVHRFDAYDGSNKWNLLLTCILFIYLIGSRIATSTMTFRLESLSYDQYQCAPLLYWTSTLFLIVLLLLLVVF